jgi:TatD DNase family protein
MVDSHCHLADEAFAKDTEAVITRAREAGLAGALCILDARADEECLRAQPLAGLWSGLSFAVGVHPHHAAPFEARAGEAVAVVAARLESVPRALAVGEIGLDFHYDFAPSAVQHDVFRAQLRFARERDLPVVIHAREADDAAIDAVTSADAAGVRGVFHCFTGDVAFARRVLDAGFHVSMAGIVSFPKASALRDVARFVPDDRLLVETDSPFLAPVPHRGKRNEPAWVVRVAEVVAEVRGTTFAAIDTCTSTNFERLFRPRVEPASR